MKIIWNIGIIYQTLSPTVPGDVHSAVSVVAPCEPGVGARLPVDVPGDVGGRPGGEQSAGHFQPGHGVGNLHWLTPLGVVAEARDGEMRTRGNCWSNNYVGWSDTAPLPITARYIERATVRKFGYSSLTSHLRIKL